MVESVNRTILIDRLVNNLLRHEYEVFLTRGAFDIAAKRERLMLIKSLTNIDGLTPTHAQSLRVVSYYVGGYPFVVSMRNNRSFLDNDTVYSRFDLPVVTPKMFNDILEEEAYTTKAAKGRKTVDIDAEMLREKRNEMKFTLQELADLIGISKKAMYEIESKRVDPTEKTAKKLERMLKIKLVKVYEPSVPEKTVIKPKGHMEKTVSSELERIGVDNSPVHNTPFEIVGREEYTVITGLSENDKKLESNANTVKRLSDIFEAKAFFVSRKSKVELVAGVPVLKESELPDVDTPRELKKLIDEKSD